MEKRRIAESKAGQTECCLQKQAAALLLQSSVWTDRLKMTTFLHRIATRRTPRPFFFFFSFLLEDFDSISTGLELCMDFIV